MLTKNDLKITEFLIRNPQGKFSIREIARRIKIDYKLAHNSMKRLTEKKIIIKTKYGKTELSGINLKEAADDLIQVEKMRAKKFLEKHIGIKIIVKEVKEEIKNPYYTLILFGSYAKGKQHQKSDLDLLIIVPEQESINQTETTVHSVTSIKPIEIHTLIITAKDFQEMLSSKEKLNVAKEVLSNHIIFHGVEAYYKMVEVW